MPDAQVKAKELAGELKWNFTVEGDAHLIATDTAGNTATATGLVPPNY